MEQTATMPMKSRGHSLSVEATSARLAFASLPVAKGLGWMYLLSGCWNDDMCASLWVLKDVTGRKAPRGAHG